MNRSGPSRAVVKKQLPGAEIAVDKFHIIANYHGVRRLTQHPQNELSFCLTTARAGSNSTHQSVAPATAVEDPLQRSVHPCRSGHPTLQPRQDSRVSRIRRTYSLSLKAGVQDSYSTGPMPTLTNSMSHQRWRLVQIRVYSTVSTDASCFCALESRFGLCGEREFDEPLGSKIPRGLSARRVQSHPRLRPESGGSGAGANGARLTVCKTWNGRRRIGPRAFSFIERQPA